MALHKWKYNFQTFYGQYAVLLPKNAAVSSELAHISRTSLLSSSIDDVKEEREIENGST